MAPIRESMPHSGLDVQIKVRETFSVVRFCSAPKPQSRNPRPQSSSARSSGSCHRRISRAGRALHPSAPPCEKQRVISHETNQYISVYLNGLEAHLQDSTSIHIIFGSNPSVLNPYVTIPFGSCHRYISSKRPALRPSAPPCPSESQLSISRRDVPF